MRILIILLLILTSCSKKDEPKFQKINYSLSHNYLDSLGKKIKPNGKYQYWAYTTYYEGYGDQKIKNTILKQGGDTLLKKHITEKFKPFGFFEGGHPSYRCNYAITIENKKVRYIKSEKEFRTFLGSIDNLEEALLLAKTYSYQLDTELKASEYRKVGNGYELHLMKFHQYPPSKELFEIKINNKGFIKAKSLGIYKKGKEVYE